VSMKCNVMDALVESQIDRHCPEKECQGCRQNRRMDVRRTEGGSTCRADPTICEEQIWRRVSAIPRPSAERTYLLSPCLLRVTVRHNIAVERQQLSVVSRPAVTRYDSQF